MKKTISTLLVLVLLLSLAACSKKTAPAAVSSPYVTPPPVGETVPEETVETTEPEEIQAPEEIAEPTEVTANPEPEVPVEADDAEKSESDPSGMTVTEVFVVELEEGQALGGG